MLGIRRGKAMIKLSPDKERIYRAMYDSYMEIKDRKGNKRKHPSFDEYMDILMHMEAWNLATEKLLRGEEGQHFPEMNGGEDGQHDNT